MEGKVTELERPSLPYSSVIVEGSSPHGLTPSEAVQFRAIEHMLMALAEVPPLMQHLADKDITVGDPRRLRNPLANDVLLGVCTPADLIVSVGANTQTEESGGELRTFEKELREWGQRMLENAKADPSDDNLDAKAKKVMEDVVGEEAPHLGLEPKS